MQRVLVIGSPGAGKSTFARVLARRTGLPLTHLDAEYWLPGWVRPEREVWEARLRELTSVDTWILDGNYTYSDSIPRCSRVESDRREKEQVRVPGDGCVSGAVPDRQESDGIRMPPRRLRCGRPGPTR